MKLQTILADCVNIYQSGVSIYLTSGPGRGKTQTVQACPARIAAALGKSIGIVTISGPLLTPSDTVGYLVPVKHPDGRVSSKFTDPFWWVTDEGKYLHEYDGGVIFIDEADKADVDIKKLLGEMALSGRCGPHRLPNGWVVWMAGNRAQDRSGSTKELDHLINRRFEISITDDLAGFEKFCMENDVHHAITAFAVQNPHIVFAESVPEKQGPWCTPRSLVRAAQFLVSYSGGKGEPLRTDDSAIEWVAGAIGQAAAAQLFATIRLESELPKIETIIANPAGAKLPGAPDAQMLTAYRLAALAKDSTLEAIIEYIERLPADFSVTFAKSLCTRDPMFVAKKPMLAWSRKNSAIMSAMAALS